MAISLEKYSKSEIEKRTRERRIFAAFLEVQPLFAGEPLADWDLAPIPGDFPDVQGRTAFGRTVGVELAEWLHQDETADAVEKERCEATFIDNLQDLPHRFQHFGWVYLLRKEGARLRAPDVAAFRDELVRCLIQCDQRWPSERFWQSPQGARLRAADLEAYPTLSKYLTGLHLIPKTAWRSSEKWIWFYARVGSYDENTMFRPLAAIVREKLQHYAKDRSGFEHLTLLVYYDMAVVHNSPPETPWFSFEDAAEKLSSMLGEDGGVFDQVIVFIAVTPGRRCLPVFPKVPAPTR